MLRNTHTLSTLPWVRPLGVIFTLSHFYEHFTQKLTPWINSSWHFTTKIHYIPPTHFLYRVFFSSSNVPITFILLIFLHIVLPPLPLFRCGVIIEKAVWPKSPVCNPHSINTLIEVQIQYSLITPSLSFFYLTGNYTTSGNLVIKMHMTNNQTAWKICLDRFLDLV